MPSLGKVIKIIHARNLVTNEFKVTTLYFNCLFNESKNKLKQKHIYGYFLAGNVNNASLFFPTNGF